MNRPLLVIYLTTVLNAVGIGLIIPILPSLLKHITGADDVAPIIGVLIALYAVMQLIFAPVLGAISDRFGRRPVLLVSLAGAAIDYLVLAFAPDLWMLFVGRAVAGVTSATGAVAAAVLTDISDDDQRARRFGLLNAMFGAGFILGPILGGALGDGWLRLPFLTAALLNGANLLLALLALPETRGRPGATPTDPAAVTGLRPVGRLSSLRGLMPVVLVFFIFSATGEAYGVCWALWGHDAFQWNGWWIGLSLGSYGLCQALALAFLPGRAVALLGERGAVLAGVACGSIALIALAFATATWMVFATMPLFALAGIGVPALQSFATRQVGADQQGQLQGVLASTVSLASIVAPLTFATIYGLVQKEWPGAIWLSVVVAYGLGAALVLTLRFTETGPGTR